jgi:Cu/Ag efflux pump CusA
MATVVVGGLVTATILTLIVLPSIYYVWHEWLARRRSAKDQAQLKA